MIIVIVIIIILGFLLVKILKSYNEKIDTVICYTGGLGAGKTFVSVQKAIKILKRNRFNLKVMKLLKPKQYKDVLMPELYSSIPIRISKNEWAKVLTIEHLLLQERLIPKSVVLIDEVGSFASQFDYKNKNIIPRSSFDEFVRLFRHYTLGGTLIVNDQSILNVVLQIRRRINRVYVLQGFRKILFFWKVYTRNISTSDEIINISTEQLEKSYNTLWGFKFSRLKNYDTYCYYVRYLNVPLCAFEEYNILESKRLLSCDTSLRIAKTNEGPFKEKKPES